MRSLDNVRWTFSPAVDGLLLVLLHKLWHHFDMFLMKNERLTSKVATVKSSVPNLNATLRVIIIMIIFASYFGRSLL